jgi:hypothetical protein
MIRTQTFFRTDNEGSKGILFNDPDTPNKDHLINGGGLWPRKTVIAEEARELGVRPEDINVVEVTFKFKVISAE